MTSSTSLPLPRRRPTELPYPFRERLTFRTTTPPQSRGTDASAVLVDLYPFQPRINELDGASPSHGVTLSWVLYIPSSAERESEEELEENRRRRDVGRSRDARRRVPQWLYHFCQAHGLPLVSIDHDYLSSSPSTSEPAATATTLTATLDELLLEDHLNWSILSTGPNAEAETGQVGLGDDYALFRLRGGVNLQRTLVVAAGECAEEVVKYFGASPATSTASSGDGAEGALDPAAIIFIDPQPPSSGSSLSSFRQRQTGGSSSSSSRPFPPTLILSSDSAPPSSLSASATSSADYAHSLLSGIRVSSPEAAALDELLENGGKSQQQQQHVAADPAQRYLLRLLSSPEDLQSLRANSNEQQQFHSSSATPSQSSITRQQQQPSAELPQTLGLLQSFLLNWLGTAAAGQPGSRPNVGVAKIKLGERPTSVSKSRL